MRNEVSVDVDASPDAVWDLLMQPARYPEIMDPADEMVDIGDGIVREGYVYQVSGGIAPFKSTSTWTVTTFNARTHQRHEGDDGKVKVRADWQITPIASGCRVIHSSEIEPTWFLAPVMAVVWPVVMRARTGEAMGRTMANVKRLAEEGVR